MARIKHRYPRQHYVPPAILFARKRQLLLRLISLFQLLGIEVRISTLRRRNLDADFAACLPVFPNPPSYNTTLLPPLSYQEGEQTLAEDTLPDTTSAISKIVITDDEKTKNNNNE